MNHTLEHEIAESRSRAAIGFWLYLMSDALLFASLFAAYVVLRPGVANGPAGSDIFQLPFVLAETLILLTSSLTCGLALVSFRFRYVRRAITLMVLTFLLGATFLGFELYEFTALVAEGDGWQRSAFLSSFFTLVGMHGLHILIGLIWLGVMIGLIAKRGMTTAVQHKLAIFGIYWHFLDLVWIFIFTVVYLGGFMA